MLCLNMRLMLTRRSVVSATINQVFLGDQNDFEGVVSRYSPVLFRVAFRRLRNIEDAEDAVQDAFLSAHKYIGQFQGRSQLSTWLTSIVTNAALMKLRRRPRHETMSLDQDQKNGAITFARKLIHAGPTPETVAAQSEMHQTLHRALAQLCPNLRSAIELRELAGLSTREAGNALGITQSALKTRIIRARASLRLLLSEVNRTRHAAEMVTVVNKTGMVCRRRRLSPSSATAGPVGHRTRVRTSNGFSGLSPRH